MKKEWEKEGNKRRQRSTSHLLTHHIQAIWSYTQQSETLFFSRFFYENEFHLHVKLYRLSMMSWDDHEGNRQTTQNKIFSFLPTNHLISSSFFSIHRNDELKDLKLQCGCMRLHHHQKRHNFYTFLLSIVSQLSI
jgi:hypothetical protein